MSYTWGSNSAVRGDSTRKFVYCDLNLSYGFGPEREGPSSRALMLILRHGSIHKDRRDTDQQVACWRHRNYQLCSVFSTALKVVYTLSRDNTVSFLHEDKTKRCLWWDRPLIGWDDLSSASSAMTQIYKATGVIAPKVTHDRTQAIQYGGAEGLQPFQIHSLSKHLTDKFHRSYQSEADKEVSRNLISIYDFSYVSLG